MSRGCCRVSCDDKECLPSKHGLPCIMTAVVFPVDFILRAGGVASEGLGIAFFLSSVVPCANHRQVPRKIWGIVPRSIRTPMSRICATGVHEYPISRLVCILSLELRYGRVMASRT